MEIELLKRKLTATLKQFLKYEEELIKQDSHKEAISTSLITYLKKEFSDFPYSIDGQYNKRIINSELYTKHTHFLIKKLPKSKMPKLFNQDSEKIKKDILPDIIFHDRTSSYHNFLVIEIKKSSNKNNDDREFDLLKLEILTFQDLCYEFGAFIDFFTGNEYSKKKPYKLKIIQKGVWSN